MSLDFNYRCHEHSPFVLSPSVNGARKRSIETLTELWEYRRMFQRVNRLEHLDVQVTMSYGGTACAELLSWLAQHENCHLDIVDDEGEIHQLPDDLDNRSTCYWWCHQYAQCTCSRDAPEKDR